jgi:hypothetical protein
MGKRKRIIAIGIENQGIAGKGGGKEEQHDYFCFCLFKNSVISKWEYSA